MIGFNIISFAPNAPILLVINKIDQNERPKINEDGIKDKYKDQIKGIIRMSALKDEPKVFLEKLQSSIISVIRELSTISTMIPKSWKTLMEDIRTMPSYYLTTDQFKERCLQNKIDNYNEIHDNLVDLFQIIGVSFCYYKNRSTADYMLLNPRWLVNALYIIVTNSDLAAKNGVITQNDLYDLLSKDTLNKVPVKRVVPNLRYGGVEVNYILGVIRMFRLSYPLKDGSEFFPMLCDGSEKISVSEVVSKKSVHYIFRYTFLPANVVHRLIVEMQKDLDYKYVWYSGAVFRNSIQCQVAYICSKGNDLHIYVESYDGFYNPNEYLTPIQSDVRAINEEMGISANEYMTYQENEIETEIPFEEVKGNLSFGIYKGFNRELKKVIDYREVAHRYIDSKPKLSGNLLEDIIKALGAMQNNSTYYKNDINSKELENSRNRYISQLLRMAGYTCNDQQTGGISPSLKFPGERDIVIFDSDGQEYLIYEGMNLNGITARDFEQHLEKLIINYNPRGLPYSVLVTYLGCLRSEFFVAVGDYTKKMEKIVPESCKIVGEPVVIPTVGQYLRCIEQTYECENVFFTVYHILVRVAP